MKLNENEKNTRVVKSNGVEMTLDEHIKDIIILQESGDIQKTTYKFFESVNSKRIKNYGSPCLSNEESYRLYNLIKEHIYKTIRRIERIKK